MPVAQDFLPYAESIKAELEKHSLRVEVSYEEETLSKKIRNAEMERPFYIIVVGKKEQDAGAINVRVQGKNILGSMSVEKFLEVVSQELKK